MSNITVEQLPLNVEVVGNGEPLVLIHGWGLNAKVWSTIVPALQEQYQLWLVDLPGFGRSQPIEKAATLDEMVERVASEIPDHSIVLGWSMGGLVATKLALDYPQKVTSLISLCSSPKFEAEASWPGIDAKVLSQFQTMLQKDFVKTVDRFLAIQAMGTPSAKRDIQLIREQVSSSPMPQLDALAGGLQILDEIDLRDQLSALKLPMLRMYGKLDSLVPKAVIELVSDLIPQSDTYLFSKASHAPFISYPDEFIEVLLTWLKNQNS